MTKTPNNEQKLAIEHHGGVLLKAGAGSGKTFVLIEHVIYLANEWIESFRQYQENNPFSQFEDYIRSKFSQVVLMTFTNKAVGEMSVRLYERFSEKVSEQFEQPDTSLLWRTAYENLSYLTLTTIDGFCRKLISAGFFPDISSEAPLIFETERSFQVIELIDRWLIQSKLPENIRNIFYREKKDIVSSFMSIFNDPELRLSWRNFDLNNQGPEHIDLLLKQSFSLNRLDKSLQDVLNLDLDQESKRSAFEKNVAKFQEANLNKASFRDLLFKFHSLFSAIKILKGELSKNKKSPDSTAAHNGLKKLRSWTQKWFDIVDNYENYFEKSISPWLEQTLHLFNYLDEKLDPNSGVTFGDIEYLVSLGLKNPESLQRVQKIYRYFIVDEFQDTSKLQFEIISDLVSQNFKNLFCVGDAKQAIYGFRGGEVSVFQHTEICMPTSLQLSNNYRSHKNIITFNNSFFETILPLGLNFEDHDELSIPFDPQLAPEVNLKNESDPDPLFAPEQSLDEGPSRLEFQHEQNKPSPSVVVLKYKVENTFEEKLSNDQVNQREAEALFVSLNHHLKVSEENCTVLYSKLRPSLKLIKILFDKKTGFTAQIKIDPLEDPIVGLFIILLKRFLVDEESCQRDHLFLLMTNKILRVLNISDKPFEINLHHFDHDCQIWGLSHAFRKLIFSLGMTIENTDLNFEIIDLLTALFHENPENILTHLNSGKEKKISIELRYGSDSSRLKIMTAHASKGLEFDAIYLGGIYTNGKKSPSTSLFGQLPGSFQWSYDLHKKVKKKSPTFLWEEELNEFKNFSEAKRLFYVACTRAKKKIAWVDLILPEKSFSVPRNSWIIAFKKWTQQNGAIFPFNQFVEFIDMNDLIDENSSRLKDLPQVHIDHSSLSRSQMDLPFIFYNPLGFYSRGHNELMILPELSVTRITSLLDCPHKFYLENVLKMDQESIFDEEDDELFISSAKRGERIHLLLSHFIQDDFHDRMFRTPMNESEIKILNWVKATLSPLRKQFSFESEVPIKFEFFQFMIAGVPDLILTQNNLSQGVQIWDFKTGLESDRKMEHYWLQLKVYAYALYQVGRIRMNDEVTLVICFLDEFKIIEQKIQVCNEIDYLSRIWLRQCEPWKKNKDHCHQCQFQSSCISHL